MVYVSHSDTIGLRGLVSLAKEDPDLYHQVRLALQDPHSPFGTSPEDLYRDVLKQRLRALGDAKVPVSTKQCMALRVMQSYHKETKVLTTTLLGVVHYQVCVQEKEGAIWGLYTSPRYQEIKENIAQQLTAYAKSRCKGMGATNTTVYIKESP